MREVGEVQALEGEGLEGCKHARPGSRRQVLLVEGEVLDNVGVAPGVVMENVTTRGIRLNELAEGQRLAVGQALFEVVGPCEGCSRMDQIRSGLQEELRDRRGTLCSVVEGGWIRRGDSIRVVAHAAARESKNGGQS
jgi:MOSC domain-containing protein YiiM